MRVIALLALILGFVTQLILDGQTFTHALFGICCGVAALVSGMTVARKNPPHRWIGRTIAGLGLPLFVWCLITLPSAYRFQQKFNGRRDERKLEKREGMTNPALQRNPAPMRAASAKENFIEA